MASSSYIYRVRVIDEMYFLRYKHTNDLHRLCFGLFLSLMDTSIIATSILTIATEFNSLANAYWVVLSYQLAYLGMRPLPL